MAEHHVARLREEAVVDVQVRAADRGGGDAQNDVVRLFDLRIRDVIDGDFAGMVEDECFHSRCSLRAAAMPWPYAGVEKVRAGNGRTFQSLRAPLLERGRPRWHEQERASPPVLRGVSLTEIFAAEPEGGRTKDAV